MEPFLYLLAGHFITGFICSMYLFWFTPPPISMPMWKQLLYPILAGYLILFVFIMVGFVNLFEYIMDIILEW